MSLFVMENDDILIDNGYSNGTVDRITLNGSVVESVMYVTSSCTGLFIDKINDLYCSSANQHHVFKVELNKHMTKPTAVAGSGCPGPIANMLDHPHGIYVDENLNLFVADTHNNRIQRFELNQRNAVTIAGFGSLTFFILNRPTSIIFDGNGVLYIVDSQNHRIVRSILNGFECLFGCSDNNQIANSQLNNPQTMAFDKNGHIFVADSNNHRIRKYSLITTPASSMFHLIIIRDLE